MATLVSYQAYRDNGAADRVSFYTRKSIMNFEEDGTPIEEIVMQPARCSPCASCRA